MRDGLSRCFVRRYRSRPVRRLVVSLADILDVIMDRSGAQPEFDRGQETEAGDATATPKSERRESGYCGCPRQPKVDPTISMLSADAGDRSPRQAAPFCEEGPAWHLDPSSTVMRKCSLSRTLVEPSKRGLRRRTSPQRTAC